jgi:hypothetical protein
MAPTIERLISSILFVLFNNPLITRRHHKFQPQQKPRIAKGIWIVVPQYTESAKEWDKCM